MNKTLEVLKSIYKPYRYTIKNKSIIIETTSGNYVLKEKGNKDIKELYVYLKSRAFDNFVPLVDGERKELNVFDYVEEINTPPEQKATDLVNVVANLHSKTTYFKEVSESVYQEIFDTISGNITYLKDYYQKLILEIEKEIYMAPSHYEFIRNSSKVMSALSFCEEELLNWYELVKNNKKQRVALIHNNLEIDHLIKGSDDVLISWDNAKIDSPVLDFVKFYQHDYLKFNFDVLFEQYNDRYPLSEDEKKLFFIIISIPPKIEFKGTEFNNCKEVRVALDYLFKTEMLVEPYYKIAEIEEVN